MKQGRIALLILTGIFLLTEIIFAYVVLTNGDGDLLGASIKTLCFLLFILLFSKKLNWAKWVLSISLILYGLIGLLLGFQLMVIFYAIGLFNIFFGIHLHTSKSLSVFRQENLRAENSWNLFTNTDHIIDEPQFLYPSLAKRYKALFIDSILVFFILIVIMILVQDSEFRTPLMVSAAGLILLTYEPLLTSYSRTVGQRLMKIRVGRLDNPMQRINLLRAYLRWFIKGLLGWISFVTIHFNRNRRAIHDLVSDSVVISEE